MHRFLVFLGLLCLPLLARAAMDAPVLQPSPGAASVAPGETLPVSFQLSSAGHLVNAIEATIHFPTEFLEVTNLTREESIFSLWPEEPRVDQSAGIIRFTGGVPNGRVTIAAPVLTVTFRARRSGRATISVDPTSRYALNDGAGTTGSLVPTTTQVTIAYGDSSVPRLVSPTHPDETRWWSRRMLLMQWPATPQAFYSFRLSREQSDEADLFAEDDVGGRVSYPELVDGRWYFSLRERLAGQDWGPLARYQIRIDATAPDLPIVRTAWESAVAQWLLVFGATDATSGVQRYDVLLARPAVRWFPFFLRGDWKTRLNPVPLGAQPLLGVAYVRAVDAAGNARTAALVSPQLRRQQAAFFLTLGVLVAALAVTLLALRLSTRR